jgi:hypothetical protein
MPYGGARSATLERMSAWSLTQKMRGQISSSHHERIRTEVDTYVLAV